jgi:hypothetical protein
MFMTYQKMKFKYCVIMFNDKEIMFDYKEMTFGN